MIPFLSLWGYFGGQSNVVLCECDVSLHQPILLKPKINLAAPIFIEKDLKLSTSLVLNLNLTSELCACD